MTPALDLFLSIAKPLLLQHHFDIINQLPPTEVNSLSLI